jgi:predicted transcriptional regulator
MERAKEKIQGDPQERTATDDLVAKVKAVAQSQHGELFSKIVDDFYEQVTEEYFSPEDLAEIEEGFAQIKRGEYVTLEELEKDLGL